MEAVERLTGRLTPPRRGERLRLDLRNLYILPTRFGWMWLAGALLLLVVGIQLQRNGPLLLAFLMLALFLLTLHLTHLNLQGLELRCTEPAPGFAGSELTYPLEVRSPGRCEGLRLRLGTGPPGPALALARGDHRLSAPWTPRRRGRRLPGCLRLETSAPLGLFVCWSRWEPTVPQLVWPARRRGPVAQLAPPAAPEAAAAGGGRREGSDDWQDLRPHRPEDAPGRLAWKLLAQGRGRHSKWFSTPPRAAPLLAPDPAVPFETALEHLAERIWRLHGRGESYGLALGTLRIPPGRGAAQRDRCLTALALAEPSR
jgi:uncharacterized protein (DUF58 family)